MNRKSHVVDILGIDVRFANDGYARIVDSSEFEQLGYYQKRKILSLIKLNNRSVRGL